MLKANPSGQTNPEVHVFIVSWTGQHSNAAVIEQALTDAGYGAVVIYSDRDDNVVPNQSWIRVPDIFFFGQKFESIIHRFDGQILLIIAADAVSHDWGRLVRECALAYREHPNLGIWSPSIDYSTWTLWHSMGVIKGSSLHKILQTDSIVWAMSKRVVERMKTLDYRSNIYGWGIDTAASMFCHAIDLLVTMDADLSVLHPKGSGYSQDVARDVGFKFCEQMSINEKWSRRLLIYKITYPKRERSKETIAEKIKWLVKTAEAGGISAGLKFYKLIYNK